MILLDVNILVHGHRSDAPNHSRYREWLETTVNADAAYGVCDLVLSGFLRVVTTRGSSSRRAHWTRRWHSSPR